MECLTSHIVYVDLYFSTRQLHIKLFNLNNRCFLKVGYGVHRCTPMFVLGEVVYVCIYTGATWQGDASLNAFATFKDLNL